VGPKIDSGAAQQVRVSVRVRCRRGAVDAELLVCVRRDVADGVDLAFAAVRMYVAAGPAAGWSAASGTELGLRL